jgi:hypothetical protein
LALLPLIEACRWDEASSFGKRLSKYWLLVHCFGPRIDVRNPWLLLRPERDEAPASHNYLAFPIARINADNRYLVSWSDVVTGWKVRLCKSLGLEQTTIRISRNQIVEPATHYTKDMHLLLKTKEYEIQTYLRPADGYDRARLFHVSDLSTNSKQNEIIAEFLLGAGEITKSL